MSYKVTILGKNYELPARTISVDEQIEMISKLPDRFSKGEITRREVIEYQHGFVESVSPGSLPAIEEVDVNDLFKACIDIIECYDAPAKKAKMEAALSEARAILNKPEVKQALELAKIEK